MTKILFLALVVFASAAPLSHADSKLGLQAGDTIAAVLGRQAGQTLELRLKSGEKIGGKLERVGEKLVHLTQLTGADYFEAVIEVDEIAAVIVRTK